MIAIGDDFSVQDEELPQSSVDDLAERVAYFSAHGVCSSHSLEVATQKKQCFLWPEVHLKVFKNLVLRPSC